VTPKPCILLPARIPRDSHQQQLLTRHRHIHGIEVLLPFHFKGVQLLAVARLCCRDQVLIQLDVLAATAAAPAVSLWLPLATARRRVHESQGGWIQPSAAQAADLHGVNPALDL